MFGDTQLPDNPPAWTTETHHGMTLRDWFAGKALMGLLTCEQTHPKSVLQSSNEELAQCSYELADAMLQEREKQATE